MSDTFDRSINYISELNDVDIPHPPSEIKKETVPAILYALNRIKENAEAAMKIINGAE